VKYVILFGNVAYIVVISIFLILGIVLAFGSGAETGWEVELIAAGVALIFLSVISILASVDNIMTIRGQGRSGIKSALINSSMVILFTAVLAVDNRYGSNDYVIWIIPMIVFFTSLLYFSVLHIQSKRIA
jgi:hypothetical protein